MAPAGRARNGRSIVRKDVSAVPEAIELIPPVLRLRFQPTFEPTRVDAAMLRIVLNTLKQTNCGRLLNVVAPLAMPSLNHVEDRFELIGRAGVKLLHKMASQISKCQVVRQSLLVIFPIIEESAPSRHECRARGEHWFEHVIFADHD